MKCPGCGWTLGEGLREGQFAECPRCGKQVKVHYTWRDQLGDPLGVLYRDPKYVRPRVMVIVMVVGVLLAWIIISR